ncbi:MAG: XdhC/CoxI family protein [Deltaproteobacteria bacterium]|nr:MAG: XdhC/CoxI family protein [Deltaproteobacteria bacterium]
MKYIYQELMHLFQQGRFSVLATIIRQGGPSPRGLGTKCLIMEDGSLVGTIGGGLLEARAIKESRQVFDTGLPLRLYYSLKGTDVADTDMLCGGEVEVFLEPVSPGKMSHLAIFQEMVKVQNRGGQGLLVTVLDRERWLFGEVPKAFLNRDGLSTGSMRGEGGLEDALRQRMDEILSAGQPLLISLAEGEERVEIFVEPVISDPVLYVFGGGHVSREIVPLASRVGFKVVVIDDREAFAKAESFPGAREVFQYSFNDVMEKIPVGDSSYLVIVTRGHMHDKTVLSQALRSDARYIGMIGSKRKKKIIFEKLLQEGFIHKDLERVHSPIGLDIGAETPEEIAISIVAQLIKVRAGLDS